MFFYLINIIRIKSYKFEHIGAITYIYGGEVTNLTFQEIESGPIAHEQKGQRQQLALLTTAHLSKLSERQVA